MDYRYQPYSYLPQGDMVKMPFYMNYPMQSLYMTEMEYEKDMERMKELYPREVKRVCEFVEEECDKMEYEGSLMFDEYPDRYMMEQITDRIYKKVRENEKDLEAEQMGGTPPYGPPMRPPGQPWIGPRDDLRSLIGVILTNEMYRRRCRHRRCNRWW